jgi:hypothetical protein
LRRADQLERVLVVECRASNRVVERALARGRIDPEVENDGRVRRPMASNAPAAKVIFS